MKALYTILACLLITTSFAQNWRYNYYDVWAGNQWNNSTQQIRTYLGDGRVDTLSLNNFQNETWSPNNRCNHVYNSSNQLVEKLTKSLTGANDLHRSSYTYSSSGKIETQIDSQWDANSNDWAEVNKSVFSYDENGNVTQQLEQQPEDDGQYTDLYRIDYTYNGEGTLIQINSLLNDAGTWLDVERNIYTYTPSGKINTVLSQVMDTEWENSRKLQYQYNTVDSVIKIQTDRWMNETTWKSYMRSDFSYTNQGIKSLEMIYFWQDQWLNYGRRRFEFNPVSTLSVDEFESGLSLFPNPVSEKLNIVSDAGVPMTISFIDVTGKVMLEIYKTAEMSSVSTESLASGVYNVLLTSGSYSIVKRIIKL